MLQLPCRSIQALTAILQFTVSPARGLFLFANLGNHVDECRHVSRTTNYRISNHERRGPGNLSPFRTETVVMPFILRRRRIRLRVDFHPADRIANHGMRVMVLMRCMIAHDKEPPNSIDIASLHLRVTDRSRRGHLAWFQVQGGGFVDLSQCGGCPDRLMIWHSPKGDAALGWRYRLKPRRVKNEIENYPIGADCDRCHSCNGRRSGCGRRPELRVVR